jgi:hypothetical protein
MQLQRNGPEGASPHTTPVVTGTSMPHAVKRTAPAALERAASDGELPPVWIRMPDVGPDTTPARQAETLATDAEPNDRQRWPLPGADGPRQGSSLVTVAAVAILALTLYLVLPGRGRGRPSPPDNGPPPAWNPSPPAGRWKGPTAESLPPDTTQPPAENDQTAGAPPGDVAPPLDQRLGTTAPWLGAPATPEHLGPGPMGPEHVGLAELDGTIETSTLHRARREPADASLH